MHLQSLKLLLSLMVKEELHLQENTIIHLDLRVRVKVIRDVAQYWLLSGCCVQRFRRRCINRKMHYLTFDLGVKVTQNVAQYPLRHVTYRAAKFEAATSNGLGGDAFTRKNII